MGWMANSLEKRGVDPCPRYGDAAAKKAECEKPAQEARVTKNSDVTKIVAPVTKKRGRPSKGQSALTAAERKRAERARKKASLGT